MPFYKGKGGAIFEMDFPNPRNVNAVELREQQIAKGDLVEVSADAVEWIEEVIGETREGKPIIARRLVDKAPPAEPAPTPKASKADKATAAAE